MFDKIVYILIGLFYVLLVLNILPVNITSLTGVPVSPSIPSWHLLGIFGVLFMLSFLVYALRKHKIITFGKPFTFLKAHILLALTGACLALTHSTLRLASVNTKILVTAVTLIITSGVIGKYLFAHVSNLKTGAEQDRKGLTDEFAALKNELAQSLSAEEMAKAEASYITAPIDPNAGFIKGIVQVSRRESDLAGLRRRFAQEENADPKVAKHNGLILTLVGMDNRIRMLELTKKLFGKWHAAHVPVTVLLFLTITAHVLVQIFFGNVRLFK